LRRNKEQQWTSTAVVNFYKRRGIGILKASQPTRQENKYPHLQNE
jgi:hypothetical protein